MRYSSVVCRPNTLFFTASHIQITQNVLTLPHPMRFGVSPLSKSQIHCIPHQSPTDMQSEKSRINSVKTVLLSDMRSIYGDSIDFSPISFTFLLVARAIFVRSNAMNAFQFMVSCGWKNAHGRCLQAGAHQTLG